MDTSTDPRQVIDLAGEWRFRTDPKNLGEHYPEQLHYTHEADARWMRVAYDDSTWDRIRVPACWQSEGYD